ncbi:MAG: phosphatidylserine decarboxylase family protein [Acidobacteriota bacterium]
MNVTSNLRMAKEAYPFLVPLGLLAVFFMLIGLSWPAAICLALVGFVAFFFRDPERRIPAETSLIVSPADGKVVKIAPHPNGTTRVSIFLSVLDVHINRAPVAGRIGNVSYEPGKFRVAFDDRASVENERNTLEISNEKCQVSVSQIAGILARRIVCWKASGDRVARGERIGLIKFGSRVDLLLPQNVTLTVEVGDRVQGGSSIIGRINDG